MAWAGLFLRGYFLIKYRDDKENSAPVKVPMSAAITPGTGVVDGAVLKTTAEALAEAYDNVSDAVVEDVSAHLFATDASVDTTPALTEGAFGSVENKCRLDFQRTDGQIWSTYVRGPKTNPAGGANILDVDGYSVDEADTNVAALIAALIDKVSFPGMGAATILLAEYVGGYFVPGEFKMPRKGLTVAGHED